MPIGIQSFSLVIEGNYVYVVNTQFIPILEKLGRVYFLARPRRFGKPQDAIAQIREAGYAQRYEASNKNIFLVGASITRNKRTLGKWLIEKLR